MRPALSGQNFGPPSALVSGHQAEGQERVHVFVRIRPLVPQEIACGEVPSWNVFGQRTLTCLDDVQSLAGGKTNYNPNLPCSFTYNQVFPPDAASDDVYTTVALPIVIASMKGYNGTVFAYGQTVS
jgi:centromeric protein E